MAESTLPPSPAIAGEGGFLRLLRRRDFGLLVLGQTTSTFGDFLFIVAFPFLLFAGHAGVGGLGLMLTLVGVSRLVGTPLGGLLADRWHPRVTMIVSDVGRAVVLLWLARTLATGSPALWQFGVVAIALGLLEGLFLPAYRAITPTLLPETELAAGNAVGEALNVAAAIAAQLVAGLALTTFGAPAVVGIDIATFVLSALTLLPIGARTVTRGTSAGVEAPGPPTAPVTTAPVAFRTFALNSRLFLVIVTMTAMVSVTAAGLFAVGLPVLASQRFTAAAEIYGILLVGIAVGRLGGSLAAGALVGARWRGYKTVALLVVHGAVLIALPGLHALGALLPALAVLGFADGTLLVIVVTVMQQLAPPEIRGRVMGTLTFMQTGSFPVSVALAGFAVGHWGLAPAFLGGGVGVLLVAVLAATQRVVRDA